MVTPMIIDIVAIIHGFASIEEVINVATLLGCMQN